MKRSFAATVWREGDWFVSQCLDVDVASEGETEEEALANLKEALELYFEPHKPCALPKSRSHGTFCVPWAGSEPLRKNPTA